MPKTILIIQGHPDPARGHLCHTLADAYAEGAEKAGHTVLRIEVSSLDFPLMRSQQDFLHSGLPDGLAEAGAALMKAEHVAIFFPIWHGTMPAFFKGFWEQILRPGFAFSYQDRGFPAGHLTGRSARVVVTMGMPALAFRLWFLDAGLAVLRNNMLRFTGMGPVRATRLGMVEGASEARRQGWLEKMRTLGAAAR